MSSRKINDLIFTGVGQCGSALITLVSIRMAVRGLNLEAYGLASAWLGTHFLLRGLLLMPVFQLLLYRFHEYEQIGEEAPFNRSLFLGLLVGCAAVTGSAYLGLALFPPTSSHWFLGGTLIGLLGLTDGIKGFAMNHLNLKGRHDLFSAAMLLDAILRLGVLYLLLPRWGAPAALVLAQVASAAGTALLIGKDALSLRGPAANLAQVAAMCCINKVFMASIMFFGVATWVTGVADRYFLLHYFGEAETGRYAAVYGLFAAPFLFWVATLIHVFRPRLTRHAAAPGGRAAYLATYRLLMGIGLLGTSLLAAGLWLVRLPLARLMLRPEHEALLSMLPLLLAGQVFLALGRILEQEFYIQRRIGLAVVKQLLGLTVALLLMQALIPAARTYGALVACLGYSAFECLFGWALLTWFRSRYRCVLV